MLLADPLLAALLAVTAADVPRTPEAPEGCMLPPMSAQALEDAATTPPAPRGQEIYRIVCRFHVVRASDGSGGADEELIPKMMQDLNYGFRDTQFRFVREPGVTYIDDDAFTHFGSNPLDQIPLVNSGYADGVLSWYVVPSIDGFPAGTWVGPPYTSGLRGILMAAAHTGTPRNIVTPTHEVGHLGILHHPFETLLGIECVQRTNCMNAGDLLCDTPASPGLGPGVMTATGLYFGNQPGPCAGDPVFDPDGTLYMDSSGLPGHVRRNRFTPQQTTRMRFFMLNQQGDLVGPDRPEFLVDCDGNGVDDMDEILAGQVADVNRDLVPDPCQVFAQPADLIVCGMTQDPTNRPRIYDAVTGEFRGEIWNGQTWVHQLRPGPDGFLYIPSLTVIQRLDLTTGRTHDNFVDGVLDGAGVFVDILFEPDGDLLVLDNASSNIRRYDGQTGAFLGVFSTLSNNMTSPKYMEWGPDGNIYVVGNGVQGNSVRRIDATTGLHLGAFVAPGSGGLGAGQGLVFRGPHLYVSDGSGNEVLRYDAATGDFDTTFVASGSGGLANPHCLRFGPDGHLYVASRDTDSVKRYDGATGAYLGDFVAPGSGGSPGSGGLDQPAGLYFVPSGPVGAPAAPPSNTGLALSPPRPNPTRGPTTLYYRLASPAPVAAAVFDVRGRRVRTLSPAVGASGRSAVEWDGRDEEGRGVASGIYFVRVTAGDEARTRRVQVLR